MKQAWCSALAYPPVDTACCTVSHLLFTGFVPQHAHAADYATVTVLMGKFGAVYMSQNARSESRI